jgi:shikimate dehydrogenase
MAIQEVYHFADLASRDRLDAGCSKPARLAVIGHPIAHSASPQMHQAVLYAEGEDVRYVRIDIEPGQVSAAFLRMRELGFIGCNVTVPHKLEAMAVCDEVHADARAIGAVNTICFDPDGTRGFNTDGPGFARAIADEFGVELGSLKLAILGAGGGAGQAIATQACLVQVPKLVLVNRTIGKLAPLVRRLQEISPQTEIVARSFEDLSLELDCLSCDLLVNTSSLGLKVGDPTIVRAACLHEGQRVYDTIYQPPVTALLAMAQEMGCRTANGLSMLVHQGALAFQHWFPGTEPLAIMRAALLARRT